MAELDLWGAVLDRDDIQELDAADRMALISIAVAVADNEGETEGFLLATALRRVSWGDGITDLRQRVDRLVEAGFLVVNADPKGWFIAGWLTKVSRYQSGNANSVAMAWGQRSAAKWKKGRADARARTAKLRAKSRSIEPADE